MKKAIVLCSGGLDSVTTTHYVKKWLRYTEMIVLFFNYGQRTVNAERKSSKKCADELNAKFIEVNLGWLGSISNSPINKKRGIKKVKEKSLHCTIKESEEYYVPCRNSIFLTSALALAESLYIKYRKQFDIFVGFKNEGKESYPDATPEFLKEINRISKISCAKPFKIIAPLIKKDKEDIILLGKMLGVDYRYTFSCYVSKNKEHCGKCLACVLRKKGFYWAGVEDPTRYTG